MTSRRAAIILLLWGCVTERPTSDRESQCDVDALVGCREAGVSCSWCAPVNARCSASFAPWCAEGLGLCDGAICRRFCATVAYPRCDDGELERHEDRDGADVCTCVPHAAARTLGSGP